MIIIFFIAMGVGVLTTYTQIANISGIQGLLVYVLCGCFPIVCFSFFGPMLRRRCPEGFVLTEWCYQRYGPIMGLWLSAATVLTMFLFMVGELSSMATAITSLTGLDSRAGIVVECIVTTIYTSIGGFVVSFITDTIQGFAVLVVLVIGVIGFATETHIDHAIKDATYHELTGSNKLGWMILYILFVAILTNDFFMSGFWLRTFAAKTDKDLYVATTIAAIVCAIVSTLAGLPGILAVWTGDLKIGDDMGYDAFFIMVGGMRKWVVGVILIFCVFLSTCTFDSLQSATVSTISNNVFRNKFPMWYSRVLVCVIMVPALVVAIEASANVLQIYFIADMLSSAMVPIMFLGLSHHFYFLRGLDIIVGNLAAFLAVFVFGTIYYDSAKQGGLLLLINNGVYDPNDWGAFGAFVIAPVGGVVFGLMSAGVRIGIIYLIARLRGTPFTALDKPNTIAFGVFDTDSSSVEDVTECLDIMSSANGSIIKQVETEDIPVREILQEFKWKDMLHLLV